MSENATGRVRDKKDNIMRWKNDSLDAWRQSLSLRVNYPISLDLSFQIYEVKTCRHMDV